MCCFYGTPGSAVFGHAATESGVPVHYYLWRPRAGLLMYGYRHGFRLRWRGGVGVRRKR